MKYLIASILLFFTTALYAQENSSLTILCPENWTVSLNGYVQKGLGEKRVLLFYYPENKTGTTNVMTFVDGENRVLHQSDVMVTGGKDTLLDLRPAKKIEVKKTKSPDRFNLFQETAKKPIAKPNFACIINKEPVKDTSVVKEPIRQQIQAEPEICLTGR
jgi:hypothetical protein